MMHDDQDNGADDAVRTGDRARAPDPQALALTALGWILADEARVDRFLGVTGIAPHELASALGNPLWLAGVLRYLEQNETDLILCADAMNCHPQALVAARTRLDGSRGYVAKDLNTGA